MGVLVTGGAGFIGSHIVDRLVNMAEQSEARGSVAVIDNLSNGRKENINERAVFHKMDICDKSIETVFKDGIDIVIHHAANVFVAKSIKDPLFDATSNILGSLNMLENCRKYGVKKIIYANSGGACYGEPQYFPINEKHPIKPLSPYGASKHVMERYLEIYRKLYGLRYTSLRYANVYGPRQNPEAEGGVIAIFLHKLLRNQAPAIFGDGEQTRDFVFVDDVVDANILAMEKGDNDCFNVSSGKEISINNLFELIKKLAKSGMQPIRKEPINGEIRRNVLAPQKAEKAIGWKARIPLEEGIKKSVQYYRSFDG